MPRTKAKGQFDRDALVIPPQREMTKLIMRYNPGADPVQIRELGWLMVKVSEAAGELGRPARRWVMESLTRQMEVRPRETEARTEVSERALGDGSGLGETLSVEEGQAKLTGYATILPVEVWAGPVAGPTQIQRELGLARSTLHAWSKKGEVVELLTGVRKHAYPLEQFVDGRPVEGLREVIKLAGGARSAWLWLREPNPGFWNDATPLSLLKDHKLSQVLALAQSQFDA